MTEKFKPDFTPYHRGLGGSQDGISEEFDIVAGVKQGDTLVLFLLVLALDVALRKAIDEEEQELGVAISPGKFHAVVLADVDYTEDICLTSHRVEQVVWSAWPQTDRRED